MPIWSGWLASSAVAIALPERLNYNQSRQITAQSYAMISISIIFVTADVRGLKLNRPCAP